MTAHEDVENPIGSEALWIDSDCAHVPRRRRHGPMGDTDDMMIGRGRDRGIYMQCLSWIVPRDARFGRGPLLAVRVATALTAVGGFVLLMALATSIVAATQAIGMAALSDGCSNDTNKIDCAQKLIHAHFAPMVCAPVWDRPSMPAHAYWMRSRIAGSHGTDHPHKRYPQTLECVAGTMGLAVVYVVALDLTLAAALYALVWLARRARLALARRRHTARR